MPASRGDAPLNSDLDSRADFIQMQSPTAVLIYPHQLFADHAGLVPGALVFLVEEPLFFKQFAFHRQKLVFHRASMQRYSARLAQRGHRVETISSQDLVETSDITRPLQQAGVTSVRYVDPCDDWLATRLHLSLTQARIQTTVLPDPHFLTSDTVADAFARGKKRLFFTEFYIQQRKRLGLLLDDRGKPLGGRWSFDPQNRKRLPKNVAIPTIPQAREHPETRDARVYVRKHFPSALGDDAPFIYPIDHLGAAAWLSDFIDQRLARFGDYEDAISTQHDVLFHSVLTPLLNTGLLSPQQVVEAALSVQDKIPINALEGFVRQIIGWREFIRLVYIKRGRRQRSCNFWGFHREMPRSLYTGETGIQPVDHVVKKVLRTGYCHHIERLMILGNFMLLCEIHPDAVYRWFMELFIDAYDWVMVPNVYGMSQHADGGLMTTKPYISGSSYILKMSDFPKGPWCQIWDALYWRFIDRHADFFAQNPRMAVMVKQRDRLGVKIQQHRRSADAFLESLHR